MVNAYIMSPVNTSSNADCFSDEIVGFFVYLFGWVLRVGGGEGVFVVFFGLF